jgi:hypothetical protein
LTINTHLEPRYLFFGDTTTAQLDLFFDPAVVDPSSIQTVPSFGLWQEIGAPKVTTVSGPSLVHQTWRFQISCLTYGCVPKQPSVQTFKLPPFTITAHGRDGAATTVKATWPTAQVSARYYPPEVGNVRPALRPDTAIPAATYSVAPGRLAWLLDAAGVVLILAALGIVAALGYRHFAAKRRAALERSELEHALALVREARERRPADRRRAVGLLARTLGPDRERYERAASEVAWSKQEPSPERLEDLAESVDADLERER